jgi:3-phosphoshikimate 1-carboxyvinyltransferase
VIIRPAKSVNGVVSIPGDKSISHRAAIIAAMAKGESRIENFLTGEDCASTIGCLRQLGVQIEQDGRTVVVQGVGKAGFRKPNEPLDCGNSGTTMRLLAGILAGQNFESVLTGDGSLCRRPMNRIIKPLRSMGAEIDSNEGKAPLTIRGKNPLRAIQYEMPIASAQVKSCLLFAGLNADGKTTVIEPVQTRDHTERMLQGFGGDISVAESAEGRTISVLSQMHLSARDMMIPADISSAAFFIVAAACTKDSTLELPNVGINPTRTAIFDVLADLGAEIELSDRSESCGEPAARLKITGSGGQTSPNPVKITGDKTASLIDEIPILAVFGTQIEAGVEIRDAAELRVKESDRISAIVENLRRMNADVKEFEDGFRVERSQLIGAEVDSFGDHRIAMAFAVAGLFAQGETTIVNPECADISFPGFYETLESVVRR